MIPCRYPAANKSPAPVKSNILRFFLDSTSTIFLFSIEIAPFSPLVIIKFFFISLPKEITSLIDANSFEEIVTFSKQIKKNVVITRGDKGAISILNDELIECDAQKNLNIKDLTGAGDLFAAGYLHGIINNLSIKECLIKGTELSSKIIQKIGARI